MLTRREFLKLIGTATTFAMFNKLKANEKYFTLNPLIEQNPDAVFIMKTNIDSKLNASLIKEVGVYFGNSVFQLTEDSTQGVPLSYLFPIKPNLTSWQWDSPDDVKFEDVAGVVTDVNFVEGVIESMQNLGITSDKIYIRDANGAENMEHAGYGALAENKNIDIQLSVEDPTIQWTDVPDGTYFKKLAHLWPYNAPNTWLLNIAKFKSHQAGMTLCAKNLQGTIAKPHVRHCRNWGNHLEIPEEHIQPNAFETIESNYQYHLENQVPRIEREALDMSGGLGYETWASRCLDNNSVIKPGLNVIEAVYGRDGNGFYKGPHDGKGEDFMTNMIIFGKNAFYVDIIGTWLAGHEPGNFLLFHKAKEEGFIKNIDPTKIPVFEWSKVGSAIEKDLLSFDRTEILAPYLRKDDEEYYHMVDEPFDYQTLSIDNKMQKIPTNFSLYQNYPNPFNNTTTFKFNLSKNSRIDFSIFDSNGRCIEKIKSGIYKKGTHQFSWNNKHLSSGTYIYRLNVNGYISSKKMTLLK